MDNWETTSHCRKVVFLAAIAERAVSACERGRCHADATPKKSPQKSETRMVNRIMRRSSCTVLRKGRSSGAIARKKRNSISATAHPITAPAADRTNASVRNWRVSRARLAPSAERTANSCSRLAPRATNRPATFAHEISSTAKTAPSRSHAIRRTSCIWRSRRDRTLRWKS